MPRRPKEFTSNAAVGLQMRPILTDNERREIANARAANLRYWGGVLDPEFNNVPEPDDDEASE